jgi:Ca2+-transporting ATPase
VGFVGMIDPPRLEVKRSIERCGRAGVKTVMVTGDHRNTAFAIAKELGIASEAGEAVDGNELSSMSPESLRKRVDRLRVFARVSPDHKVRIVRALRETGGIVSMTGDGVNDAPSLRAADIGVAMGRGGTDVAKAAADMVLTDDNFETIVAAVEEGRNIFRNIKKTIVFLLSTNAGEFVSVFATVLAGLPLLLLPIHILWVNLVTDTLPALSLGVDPPDSDVLEEPPRAPNESLFAGGVGVSILLNGILIGFLTLAAFFIGFAAHDGSLLHARSMGFTVLSISQLFHAFNIRHARKSIVQVGLLSNRFLVGSFLLCLLLQILVVTLPAAAALFRVVTLTMRDWGVVAGLAILPVVLNEAVKLFFRMSRR